MESVYLFTYPKLEGFEFSELPKGRMFDLAMNPYNGKVYLKPEKHVGSTVVALDVMRRIVAACDLLGRNGSTDPLRELLALGAGFDWESLSKAARGQFVAFEERSESYAEREAAEGQGRIKQAS